MATPSSHLMLADRAEVHKSCKSLELIANVLNDYCQAADIMVSTQKKLSKALREAHNLKGVNDIVGENEWHPFHCILRSCRLNQ